MADGFGNVIDSLTYSDQPPWPNADGNGYYLELIDPLSDNSIASNWTASTNTIVSVRETDNGIKFRVYPTPVKDRLTVESSGTIKIVELYDYQGRQIRKIIVDSGNYILDMSSLSRGIYVLRVFTYNRSFVQKIVKE
jgi:hypothetical protein